MAGSVIKEGSISQKEIAQTVGRRSELILE